MEVKNWADVPELVGFNITSKCNLHCSYCFELKQQSGSDATLEEVLFILSELNTIGVPEVLIEGGEIFMLPYINELLFNLDKFQFRTHLISNGTLLQKKHVDILSNLNISIGISLDGPLPKHNMFRGNSAYYKAISAIEMLTAKGVTVYINCTVTKANFDSIPDMITLCHNLGVYGLVLQQLHCSGAADAEFYKKYLLEIPQIKSIKDFFPSFRKTYPDLYFVESELFDFLNAPERFTKVCDPQLEYKPKRTFRCAAGRRFCMIQSNLDVIPCGILGNFPCGNLRKQSFKNLWEKSEQLTFIRQLSEIRVDRIAGCANCQYNPVCDGGCRGDMYNFTGDWLATHILCPFAS